MFLNRVRVVWTGVGGSPAYTNFYTNNGLVTASNAQSAVIAWCNSIKTTITNAATMNIEGDVALIDSVTDSITGVTSVGSSSVVGTVSTGRVPGAVQIVVRRLTGSYAGGRQIRGRLYIPYAGAGVIAATGVVSPTTVTNVNAAMTAYKGALIAGADVVYSRVNKTGYAVTSDVVWNEFGVMRSRRD